MVNYCVAPGCEVGGRKRKKKKKKEPGSGEDSVVIVATNCDMHFISHPM